MSINTLHKGDDDDDNDNDDNKFIYLFLPSASETQCIEIFREVLKCISSCLLYLKQIDSVYTADV